jgi:hypothetical protein
LIGVERTSSSVAKWKHSQALIMDASQAWQGRNLKVVSRL